MNLAKIGFVACIFLISACEAQNLYVAHDTVVGINAQLSQDRQKGRLVVGYDRDFATIIPRSVDMGNGREEVMSSLGCNHIVVDGISLTEYRDMVVTGDAAIALAKELEGRGELFKCDPSAAG
ncbi:MAG: hypothetical protein GY952_06280 [Rhodobacteraceae bacterium]|nr:hypothetical protein [Paracoccaceae bacterium]